MWRILILSALCTVGQCNIKEEPDEKCQGKQADVVFIVDRSASIWPPDYRSQLNFIADVVSHFDIAAGKTRVAMIQFSDNASVVFYFDENKSSEQLTKDIKGVTMLGGITNTHKALRLLLDDVLTRKHGSRPEVEHISILITDGRSSVPYLAETEAQRVHDSGVYMFAIGVGNMTDNAELAMMASKPTSDYAFEVDGYKALKTIKNLLAYKACKLPGDQPRCANDLQADLVFGVHGIGGGDRTKVTEFIKTVGAGFNLPSGNVRIGLQESCGDANFDLSDFEDGPSYATAVVNAMSTSLDGLLYRMRIAYGSRPNANRIAVLLISGDVQDMDKAYRQAMRMKYNTRIIVVGVGKSVNTEELKRLASAKNKYDQDNSHVFPVDSADDLVDIVKKLQVLMCNEQ